MNIEELAEIFEGYEALVMTMDGKQWLARARVRGAVYVATCDTCAGAVDLLVRKVRHVAALNDSVDYWRELRERIDAATTEES